MLNETNFKVWKEAIEIFLVYMDLDLVLQVEKLIPTPNNLQDVKIEKWERSNRMCLMIMKCSILEAFQGSIFESQSARKFLEEIEQFFAKNEKAKTSNLLVKLISMKYKDRENIREYIMKMSSLSTKLKSLKLELGEDLILISLPTYFGSFFETRNVRILEEVEFEKEENIRNVVFEEEYINDIGQVLVPIIVQETTLVIGDNQTIVPDIVAEQDYDEVLLQTLIEQPQQS
ncbi:hypothetical protein CR513_42557, partial [Mucuna pruriens]